MRISELPSSAWREVRGRTMWMMFVSVAVSVGLAHVLLTTFSGGLDTVGLVASITVPLVLGGPLTFWNQVRLQQLRLANQKLEVLASTDWLTACLNRRAFTQRLSAQLEDAGGGALLVIDADNFKLINDQFGHDRGDEVLQLLAQTIQSRVGAGDLVGRLGGEEFGVFLSGAGPDRARRVAEQIRADVGNLHYVPDGERCPLSVSIGGALGAGGILFSDLFRLADQQLYQAKQSGRDRVAFTPQPTLAA